MNHLAARALFHLRSLLQAHYGLLVCLAAAILLARGAFGDLGVSLDHGLALGVSGLLFILLPVRLLSRGKVLTRWGQGLWRLEKGLVLLLTVFVALQIAGGPGSAVQPLVYLAAALLAGFNRTWQGGLFTLAALGLQALAYPMGSGRWGLPDPYLVQAGYITLFAAAGMLVLQAEVARQRREHRRRFEQEVQAMRAEARDFRLISSALTSEERRDREADELRLAQGAVEAIHQDMYSVLDILKRSLDLQTCVVLWLDASGQQLRIKELVTDSRMVHEVPFPAQAGLLGNVVKNRILLNLRKPPRGSGAIPYYNGPEEVAVFAGVPIIENNHLCGVLCADRRQDRPFEKTEEDLLLASSQQILRSIQTERVLSAVERSKYEHERFYRASSSLNSALTLSQVYDMAFAAADEITAYDFGALTLYDAVKRRHIICRVRGEAGEGLEGESFGDNAGLVSMVVKNRHFLPAGEELRERDTMVFTRKLRLKGLQSILVLPLVVKDEAIGTVVLGAQKPAAFGKKLREMLGVISNQVAVAIENAKMYKRMEEMATTDGLTGLPNHRTFQSRLSEMLARAERRGKPLSVVLTDVDKFKSVNDTYGHPVGDAVLRRIAQVLASQARKVDLVARYGGEEFVMVLEETDAEGAKLVCERVRQDVASQLMSAPQGAFRVTISLGIATYPQDAVEKAQLVERSDQALYTAKQTGRNRAVRYSEMKKLSRTAP